MATSYSRGDFLVVESSIKLLLTHKAPALSRFVKHFANDAFGEGNLSPRHEVLKLLARNSFVNVLIDRLNQSADAFHWNLKWLVSLV
jgi:hypothetical protein